MTSTAYRKRDEEMSPDSVSNELLNLNEKHDDEPNQIVQKSTKVGLYRQLLMTVFVTTVLISLANALAYPALIVPQLHAVNGTLHFDTDNGSWYTSVFSLCSPFGSMVAGFMMDRYGRRITLATPIIPIIITWVFTATAQTQNTLFISRVFQGIFSGFGPPVCQVYLAECADSEFRGVTINVGYVSLSIGFLLTFALGAAMDWRQLAWCGIVFPMMTLIGVLISPESPIWLIRKDRIDEAFKTLLWLRGNATIARTELNENLSRINQEREASQIVTESNSLRDFLRPAVLKPITIIFSFILLFNLSGTYLIIYYAIDILSQVNLTMSAAHASVILSIVRLIVTVGFCWLFMKVKRRNIYLIAGIGSTVSTLVLGVYLHTNSLLPNDKMNLWVPGSLLLLFVATNTGFMIAPGFLTGELLPAKIRGRLAGYIYTYFSIVTFILNKFFPNLNAHIGLTGVIFLFGAASLATTLVVFFMVPETKDQSLLAIETYFQTQGWIYKKSRISNSTSS